MNLNKDGILMLIQQYRKHRILWDSKDQWYFNKNKKNEAWAEVARTMKIDPDDAKQKIWSLLGSFRRERGKGKSVIQTENGLQEVFNSDWYAFKHLVFLIENKEQGASSTQTLEDIKYEVDDCLDVEDTAYISQSTEDSSFPEPTSMQKRKRVKSTSEYFDEDPLTPKTSVDFQYTPARDDTTTALFTKYLLEKLNQFNSRTRTILIHKINMLIFEAEMTDFSSYSFSDLCSNQLNNLNSNLSTTSSVQNSLE